MIKRIWLKYFLPNDAELPKFERIIQSWDTAIKSSAQSDFSVGLTFGIAQNNVYLLDVVRAQMEYPDLRRAVIMAAEKWNANLILIEDKASGQSLLQDLWRETKLSARAILPKNDKLTRMSAVSPIIESGRLHLDRRADWLRDFEAELLSFPNAKNDDQVDALSQFLQWFKDGNNGGISMRKI